MHVVLNYNSMLHSLIGLRVVVNNNQTFSSILKFEFTVDENHHLLMVRQLCYAPIESRALSRFTGFITLSVFVTNPIFVLATKKPRLCLHVEQGTILYRSSPRPPISPRFVKLRHTFFPSLRLVSFSQNVSTHKPKIITMATMRSVRSLLLASLLLLLSTETGAASSTAFAHVETSAVSALFGVRGGGLFGKGDKTP